MGDRRLLNDIIRRVGASRERWQRDLAGIDLGLNYLLCDPS